LPKKTAGEEGEYTMDHKSLLEEAYGYLRLALPLMSGHAIPVTPKNYSVWYKYVSGTDSELRKTIDSMLEKGESFSEETNETLYFNFCTERDERQLGDLRDNLQQILVTILREVTELTGQTQKYESFMSDTVKTLSSNPSPEEVWNIAKTIIDETKRLGSLGKTVQTSLAETTDTLAALKKDFEQVKTEALVDFLTGVPNRKAFDQALTEGISEATSDQKYLSLLMIDIDHFKRFNDEYGHLIGDYVLKFVAKKIKEMVKGRDFPARFGGEEFAVILPQTPLVGAETVAENIRSYFAQTTLKETTTLRKLGKLTVSIGVACYRLGESPEKLIARCDEALYSAKNTGRNRVATESDTGCE
jgi:diguanylate cyclase